jgi:subtilase family serine protease
MSLYSSTILSDSPLAYWRLGELSGTSAADATANANTATYGGTFVPGHAGAIAGDNNAALKAGATGYATVVTPTNLDFAGNLSLECWANFGDTSTSLQYFLEKKRADNSQTQYYFLWLSGSLYSGWNTGSGANKDHSVAWTPTVATWYHLAATADGSNVKFFVNGAQQGSSQAQLAAPTTSGGGLIRLAASLGATNPFTGIIDEIAVYNAALTPAQIARHYNAGIVQGIGAPPVGGCPFIQNPGAGSQ